MFISDENFHTSTFHLTYEISCVNILAGGVTVDLLPFVSPCSSTLMSHLSIFHFP